MKKFPPFFSTSAPTKKKNSQHLSSLQKRLTSLFFLALALSSRSSRVPSSRSREAPLRFFLPRSHFCFAFAGSGRRREKRGRRRSRWRNKHFSLSLSLFSFNPCSPPFPSLNLSLKLLIPLVLHGP